jgi:hypothetical protein
MSVTLATVSENLRGCLFFAQYRVFHDPHIRKAGGERERERERERFIRNWTECVKEWREIEDR